MPDLSALVQRWQGGDERATEAIYHQHWEATGQKPLHHNPVIKLPPDRV
jgi:hypothetical protein